MLPSKTDPMEASQETGGESPWFSYIGFGCALMPFYLGLHPPEAAFSTFGQSLDACRM